MNREQKVKEVEGLKKKFQVSKAVLFAENKGLKVAEVMALRKLLKKENTNVKVVKNRLLKRALQESQIQGLEKLIEGALTITFSESDPVAPAKVLVNFIKENERLLLKGGFVDGKVLSLDQVKALASLPSRQELYGMLLRCLNGPAVQIVSVLAAVPRQLVCVIEAIRKQKENLGST